MNSTLSRPSAARAARWCASVFCAALVGLTLSACGGGSSSGGGTSAPSGGGSSNGGTTPPPPSTAQYDLQTSVPAATYVAGSARESVYKTLNDVRSTGGFGLLTQNTALDQAAQAHAQYVANTLQIGHTEVPGTPGFTGVDLAARIQVAGYVGAWAGEVVGGGSAVYAVSDLPYGVLNTIYHAQALESGARDVGIGVAVDPKYNQNIVVIVIGYKTTPQLPVAGQSLVYPLANQKSVLPAFPITAEVPRPLPEINTAGHPVFFTVNNVAEVNTAASSITVNSFTLKDSNGNLVPALLMTAPTVKVASGLASAQRTDSLVMARNFYLVPVSALLPNVTYTAEASVTTPSATYTKTWSFTTGN